VRSLPRPTVVRSLIVVGSSGTGKTTIVDGLRSGRFADHVVVPRRFVTRRRRVEEGDAENLHLNNARFEDLLRRGSVFPEWERTLEHGRRERYGFEAVRPDEERLRVYSANNAFLRDRNPTVERVLAESIVVVVRADPERRRERMSAKQMSHAEREARLADDGADLARVAGVRVIDTTALLPEGGRQALLRFVVPHLPAPVFVRAVAA
jgi:ribose 1,5-bisphosphokinase PhnN